MTSSDIFLISPNLCKNLSIQTSEKIKPQNIYNFLTTLIQSNDITLDINDKIFYHFICESNIYEIYIINTTNEYIQTQASIYNSHYTSTINDIDLFITNDYFAVYKDSKLYFFKENKNYQIEDILSFVNHKYKIDINNTIIINKNQIVEYENIFIEKNNKYIKFIKPIETKFYLYYIIYLVILVIILIIYEINIKKPKKIISNKIVYQTNKDILFDIVKIANIYKLQIQKLQYKDKYKLQIVSTNKKNFNKFLSYYKDNINIKNIYKVKNKYILEFELEQ